MSRERHTVAPYPHGSVRVLVCGGRDFDNAKWLRTVLDELNGGPRKFTCVIHGAARGADSLAAGWAQARGILTEAFPANWKEDGRAAGPIRNQRMLDLGKPDLVIAFPGGKGTADMVRRAAKAALPVVDLRSGPIEENVVVRHGG